jgi:hypothetical protein
MNPVVAGAIWFGLGGLIMILGLLFCLEGVLYWLRQDLITVYIRNWSWGHHFVAIFIAVGLVASTSAAFMHFLLDGGR